MRDDEDIVAILYHFRPLVAQLQILDGQRMKAKLSAQHFEVALPRLADSEPENSVVSFEPLADLGRIDILRRGAVAGVIFARQHVNRYTPAGQDRLRQC